MSPLVTIVVQPHPKTELPSVSLREALRVDALQQSLGPVLGHEVDLLEGDLADAPSAGAILLLTSSPEQAVAGAPPGTASRAFWLNGTLRTIPVALARDGFAGAVDGLECRSWAGGWQDDRAAWIYARDDIAAKLGAGTRPSKAEGYVVMHDERWRGLASLLGAAIAVVLGREPPAPDPPRSGTPQT